MGNHAARGKSMPAGLRFAFVVHCVADCVFAVPLMVDPDGFLRLLGWTTVDPIAARIVAAALFGIGIESFLGRNAGKEWFTNMLDLKIIWSLCASAGIALSLLGGAQGRPVWGWILLLVFIAFNGIWVFFRLRIRSAESG